MKYKLNIRSIWEFGRRVDEAGNPHQEDSLFPAYGQQKDSDRLFILCDGMGGHEGGEVASSTVCVAMSKSVLENVPDPEGDFEDENLYKAIEDAFDALDAAAAGKVSTEKKMGTTMTFLKFHSKGCTIAHMGDSRVYHIRPGKGREDSKILFVTSDHSLVNDLIRIGELTPEEAKHSRQKNVITRAMQPQMERRPKADIYHTSDIQKGDYFYMCSDGMLEQMEDEHLLFNFSEATGDDDNKVKILTQATGQNSDNHTAIIVHVLDVFDPLPVENEPLKKDPVIPAPIMAEVNENPESPKPESAKPSQTEVQAKKGGKSIIRYLLMALMAFFLAFCAYYVSSRLNRGKPSEKEETEQRDTKPGKQSNPGKETPNQQPGKPNGQSPSKQEEHTDPNQQEELQQNNTESQNQSAPASTNPSKLLDAASATVSQAENNEGVVPSDEQMATDVVSKTKK